MKLLPRRSSALSAVLLLSCASPVVPPPPPPPPAPVAALPPPPPPLVHVQVLALNDFHGNLEPPHGHDGSVLEAPGVYVAVGGAAYLAAHVRRLARENPSTIIVSAGDLTGGSPLVSNLFHDEPTVVVMNHIGLDFEGVGNHDFDRGLPELTRLAHGGGRTPAGDGIDTTREPAFTGAKYEYLAANVVGPDGKTIFAPYGIKELGGVKVAIVGMTTESTPIVTTKEAVKGLTFAGEAATANALLPELRRLGVAATVLLLHEGGFQAEGGTFDGCAGLRGEILPILATLDPAFRVVVTAHTHQAYDCTFGDRIVTSASSYGRLVTQIDLAIDKEKGVLVSAHARNVPVTHDVEPDPEVVRIVQDYEARARPVTERVVGYQEGALTRDPKAAQSPSCETPLGDVIADAQLAATRAAGAVVALMNPGGIRTDLAQDAAGSGPHPITYGAAFEIQPFGNRLFTLSLTGDELHALLVRQFGRERPRVLSVSKGFTYRYVYDAPTKAVTLDPASMRLDGKVILPHATYRVTVNSFLADGGDGFALLREVKERVPGPLDIDALAAFLGKTTSPRAPIVAPKRLERILGNACQ